MQQSVDTKNWIEGSNSSILEGIHNSDVNIALYDRDIDYLNDELALIIQKDFEFRSSGDIATIESEINAAEILEGCVQIKQDINQLLALFKTIIDTENYRLYLATVSNNMCSKFHTDVNDLRMLCTYVGPGTLWLTEDNIDQAAMDRFDDEATIFIDPNRVQQAKTGSVVLLKGAIYPKEGTKPVMHRSPSVEESNQKRLLLRIDTDEFANF